MRWILHIGTPKTGSKAIQHFLTHESHRIKNNRFIYPVSGRPVGKEHVGIWHRPLFEQLQQGHFDCLQSALSEAMESRADLGIISYEGLHVLAKDKINKLHEIMGPAKIVLFLRRQDQLANSRFNQYIKAHRVGYDQILAFEKTILEYNPHDDHLKTIKRWERAFGENQILPIIYDKQQCAINQLLCKVGLVANFEGFDRKNPNPAIDAQSLSIFMKLKRELQNPEMLLNLMTSAHKILRPQFLDTYTNSEEQYLLSETQRETIYSHYKESNDLIRSQFFAEREELFPPLEKGGKFHTDVPVDEILFQKIVEHANETFKQKQGPDS